MYVGVKNTQEYDMCIVKKITIRKSELVSWLMKDIFCWWHPSTGDPELAHCKFQASEQKFHS